MDNRDKTKESKLQPGTIKVNTHVKSNKKARNYNEGEHLEIDIFKIVKVKSHRVTPGVIIVTIIALAFVCAIIILLGLKTPI
jgi:hypothetical protein